MKKILYCVFIIFAAVLMFSGCQDFNTATTLPDGYLRKKTLQQRLDSSDSGIIDLEKENLLVSENQNLVIKNPVALKNGDLKGASVTVLSKGVSFENLSGISRITVSESVGDGDFTLTDCDEVKQMDILGGGNNSIHVNRTLVSKLLVAKKDVRIVLDDNSSESSELLKSFAKITTVFVFESCKFDSGREESSFGNVMIADSVKELALAGKTMIENLLSESSGMSDVSVSIQISVDVKIKSAEKSLKEKMVDDKNNPYSAGGIQEPSASSEEIKSVFEEIESAKEDISKAKEESEKIAEKENLSKLNFSIMMDGEKVTESRELKLEKTSEEIVFTNSAVPESDNVWYCYLNMSGLDDIRKGKNYRLSIDLKSDKDSYVVIEAKDDYSAYTGNQKLYKIGQNYSTYSVTTGTVFSDWKRGVLNIACGKAEKLYIKNFKIEEISDKSNFGISISSIKSGENVSVSEGTDGSVSISFKNASLDDKTDFSLIPFNMLLSVNKMYRLTFDVTSDTDLWSELREVDGGEGYSYTKEEFPVNIWAHGINNSYETAGSNKFYFAKDVPAKITLYLPIYKTKEEAYRIPHIYFSVKKDCVMTVSDLKAEETTWEAAINENPTFSLYFAGELDGNWLGGIKSPSTLTIPAGSKGSGQLLLCDYSLWDSYSPVTSFKVLKEGTGSFINAEISDDEEDTKIFFENKSDKEVYAKFTLDENNNVVIEECDDSSDNLPFSETETVFLIGGISDSIADETKYKYYGNLDDYGMPSQKGYEVPLNDGTFSFEFIYTGNDWWNAGTGNQEFTIMSNIDNGWAPISRWGGVNLSVGETVRLPLSSVNIALKKLEAGTKYILKGTLTAGGGSLYLEKGTSGTGLEIVNVENGSFKDEYSAVCTLIGVSNVYTYRIDSKDSGSISFVARIENEVWMPESATDLNSGKATVSSPSAFDSSSVSVAPFTFSYDKWEYGYELIFTHNTETDELEIGSEKLSGMYISGSFTQGQYIAMTPEYDSSENIVGWSFTLDGALLSADNKTIYGINPEKADNTNTYRGLYDGVITVFDSPVEMMQQHMGVSWLNTIVIDIETDSDSKYKLTFSEKESSQGRAELRFSKL